MPGPLPLSTKQTIVSFNAHKMRVDSPQSYDHLLASAVDSFLKRKKLPMKPVSSYELVYKDSSGDHVSLSDTVNFTDTSSPFLADDTTPALIPLMLIQVPEQPAVPEPAAPAAPSEAVIRSTLQAMATKVKTEASPGPESQKTLAAMDRFIREWQQDVPLDSTAADHLKREASEKLAVVPPPPVASTSAASVAAAPKFAVVIDSPARRRNQCAFTVAADQRRARSLAQSAATKRGREQSFDDFVLPKEEVAVLRTLPEPTQSLKW